jgi:hypothetical protein
MVRMEQLIPPETIDGATNYWNSLAGDGDDAACCDVAGEGKAKTSPEMGTTWLAAASLAETRNGS